MTAFSVRFDFIKDALDLLHEMLLLGVEFDHVRLDRDGRAVCLQLRADVDVAEMSRTIRRLPSGLYAAQSLQVMRTQKAIAAPRVPLALPWKESTLCGGDRDL